MKRALAERARQQSGGQPNSLPSSSTEERSNKSSPQQPPQKVPRIQAPKTQSTAPSTPSATAPKAPNPSATANPIPKVTSSSSLPKSPRGSKRQRPSPSPSSAVVSEENAFYLLHQNRALASELKALQFSKSQLQEERDARRESVNKAIRAIQELESSWTKMEVMLKQQQQNHVHTISSSSNNIGIASTGSGKNVEMITALLDSLSSLARVNGDSSSGSSSMDQVAAGIARRAQQLQESILNYSSSNDTNASTTIDTATLQAELNQLKLLHAASQTQIDELSKARDDATESDRRVRRGLYRLAAGRVKLEEVMKQVEESDVENIAASVALEQASAPIKLETSSPPPPPHAQEGEQEEKSSAVVDTAQVNDLKRQLKDLQAVATSRQEQLQEIIKEREEQTKRINSLLLDSSEKKVVSDEDVKQSSLHVELNAQLESCKRQLEEKEEQLQHATKEWAQAKGNAELAKQSLEDLQQKHKKRWNELHGDGEVGLMEQQAEEIAQLQHKLKQALENVRQAETVRVTLAEALKMNEGLQAKLEELKVKNAALVAGKSASRAADVPPAASVSKDNNNKVSQASMEKLIKEHRQMRKQLLGAKESKDLAKAKQERAEKERDALVKTNSRLVKQSAEKDDMNAKSLSTILHLKSLADKLEQEKELLEQQGKSSGQVALAARLATNAKERVEEEALKEKQALEEQLAAMKAKCESLQQEKETAQAALSQSKAEMMSLQKSTETSKTRCEELAREATKDKEEKARLVESLAVAQRESTETAKRLSNLSKSQGMSSEFTTEELTTQVSVLKGRLACPVCNVRDKKCILLRCRHMFCKQCVEENVRNRSRKCPACGQRFDNKDVADVWL